MKSDFTLAVRFATIGCNIFDAVKITWDGKVAKGETVNIPTQKKICLSFPLYFRVNVFVFSQ